MGVTVDSVNEGEFINVTLKNGTKAKVVATDSGAYLEEIVVPETYEQTSMSILFKKLDSLAAM